MFSTCQYKTITTSNDCVHQIATASSVAKLEVAKSKGAKHLILSSEPGVDKKVRRVSCSATSNSCNFDVFALSICPLFVTRRALWGAEFGHDLLCSQQACCIWSPLEISWYRVREDWSHASKPQMYRSLAQVWGSFEHFPKHLLFVQRTHCRHSGLQGRCLRKLDQAWWLTVKILLTG